MMIRKHIAGAVFSEIFYALVTHIYCTSGICNNTLYAITTTLGVAVVLDMWCGVVDNCPVVEGDNVTVGCFVNYEWLSTLLQYNVLVELNTTLQFLEDRPATLVGPQRPTVPSYTQAPLVDSQFLQTQYKIANVQPGQTIEATCMVEYLFSGAARAYSGRNTYAVNPLKYTCKVQHTVSCTYIFVFTARHSCITRCM